MLAEAERLRLGAERAGSRRRGRVLPVVERASHGRLVAGDPDVEKAQELEIQRRGLDGAPATLPGRRALEAGDHPIEVRFQARQDNTRLELLWQPPGGQLELLPPTALKPAPGGVWLAQERPTVRAVPAAVFDAPRP